MSNTRVFSTLALAAAGAGVYHGFAATGLLSATDASTTRHLVFVGVNALLAWYFLRRSLWMLPAFLALVVQQTLSHGTRLVEWWTRGALDVVSLAVLMVLYAATVLLLLDARAVLSGPRPPPAPR